MRLILVWIITALVLGLTAMTAVQAAGDDWPRGGSVPQTTLFGGDDWPRGG